MSDGKSFMNVLFVVTARGGSKGVPNKNITDLAGLPLLAYKIISAQRTKCDKRIILSTDSEAIAEVGRKYGAETPFVRPAVLATDTSLSADVVLHAMDWVERKGSRFDCVFVLEPTSPFGTYKDFEAALKLMESPHIDNVVGVRETEPNSIFITPLEEDGSLKGLASKLASTRNLNRQNFKKEYTPNGTLYVSRWDAFKQQNTEHKKWFYTERTYTVIQERYYSIEIDSKDDLMLARFAAEQGLVDLSYWK